MTHTISAPEVIWTGACIFGLLFNSRQLVGATTDYMYIRRRRINSIREYAAITTFVMFGSWVCIQAVFVFVGIIAMTQPNPTNNQKPQFLQFLLVIAFCSCSVFMAVVGYVVDVRRRHIVSLIAAIEDM